MGNNIFNMIKKRDGKSNGSQLVQTMACCPNGNQQITCGVWVWVWVLRYDILTRIEKCRCLWLQSNHENGQHFISGLADTLPRKCTVLFSYPLSPPPPPLKIMLCIYVYIHIYRYIWYMMHVYFIIYIYIYYVCMYITENPGSVFYAGEDVTSFASHIQRYAIYLRGLSERAES